MIKYAGSCRSWRQKEIETDRIETKLGILPIISRRNSVRCVLEQEWSKKGKKVTEGMAYDVGFRKQLHNSSFVCNGGQNA